MSLRVSIPSRGFWFFEDIHPLTGRVHPNLSFNPLAGILVF